MPKDAGDKHPRISPNTFGQSHVAAFSLRCITLYLLFLPGIRVHADVTLFLEAPINFLGHVSSTGHAALMFDSLCSDDHIRLRWCYASENGTVVSRYKGIDGYDWVAMPPGPYLFAVESSDDVPTLASSAQVSFLRTKYRENHPGSFMQDPLDDGWIQLLGASYRRRIICVHVRTNADQDDRLMQWLNDRPDRTRFNFFFSNCADFARQMLNVLFPGAIRRNRLFDFGMTTPKQLESCLHHYAVQHPELDFEVRELPQVEGDIPRSGKIYGVAESFVKTKTYLVPLAILNPIGIGSISALGIADHRYFVRTPAKVDGSIFFRSQNTTATNR